MNQQLPTLIDGMRRALRDDVQPELATDHARSQLAGVLDILAKLQTMLAWSPDVLHEQLETLRSGCDAFVKRAAREGVQREALAPGPAGAMRQAQLEESVRAAEAQLNRHTDWLFAQGTALAPRARSELDELLQQTQRDLLIAERKLIPRADFGAMTAGASKPTAAG